MKITLLTVGKTDKDWVRQGMEVYASRMKHYFPFSVVEIPELKNVSALSEEQIKTKEGGTDPKESASDRRCDSAG